MKVHEHGGTVRRIRIISQDRYRRIKELVKILREFDKIIEESPRPRRSRAEVKTKEIVLLCE